MPRNLHQFRRFPSADSVFGGRRCRNMTGGSGRLIAGQRGMSMGARLPLLRDAMSPAETRVRLVADSINTGTNGSALEIGLNEGCQNEAVELSGF
jgi:hypothetical protein